LFGGFPSSMRKKAGKKFVLPAAVPRILHGSMAGMMAAVASAYPATGGGVVPRRKVRTP